MKYYAVIDTNVLVSAMLKWDSVPGTIMELTFDGLIIPILNEHIVKEYHEVLVRPKFHFTEEIIYDVLENIQSRGIYVDAEYLDIELPDPKDRVFYEVVMEERKTLNVRKADDAVLESHDLILRDFYFPENLCINLHANLLLISTIRLFPPAAVHPRRSG